MKEVQKVDLDPYVWRRWARDMVDDVVYSIILALLCAIAIVVTVGEEIIDRLCGSDE